MAASARTRTQELDFSKVARPASAPSANVLPGRGGSEASPCSQTAIMAIRSRKARATGPQSNRLEEEERAVGQQQEEEEGDLSPSQDG